MRLIVQAFAGIILFCLLDPSQGKADEVQCPTDLKTAMDNYESALIKKDPVLLTKILTDDFQMVTATGRMLDKKAMLENLALKTTQYSVFESSQVRYRKFGDTIIETGQVKTMGVRRGTPIAEHSIYTDVWVLEGGKGGTWRLASEHSCFLQPAQPKQPR